MERKYGLTQAVRDYIAEQPYSDAFTVDDVMRATNHAFPRASVRATLHAETGKGPLRQYDSGIWYKSKRSELLSKDVPPNLTPLIPSLWLFDDKGLRIGYETGASWANKLDLSTQIPANTDIVTTRPNRKPNVAETLGIKLRTPVTAITSDNWRYLQLLDMLASNVNFDNDRDGSRLAALIRQDNFSYLELMTLAFLLYPKHVQNTIVRLSERISEC